MARINLSFLIIYLSIFFSPLFTEVIQLTESNIDTVLKSNELVLVDFYASWCYFSNLLDPIFTETSNKIDSQYKDKGKVVLAKLDCEKETTLAKKFGIRKYPTLKLFRFGEVSKHEYRGARNVESFMDFLTKQLVDPFKYIGLEEKVNNEIGNNNIIVYMKSKDEPNFELFRKVALQTREDCIFYIKASPQVAQEHLEFSSADKPLDSFNNFNDGENMRKWILNHCTPIVRNITFQNAEDITEEGLPLVLLFYKPQFPEITAKFTTFVAEHLMDERRSVNFVYADGDQFSHPLMHLGKSSNDLPLIAVDSFQHMFILSKSVDEALTDAGILKKFVSDLHSGKLHREFHNGPDPEPVPQIEGKIPQQPPASGDNKQGKETTPIPSVFKKLKPNSNRYTLFHDEF